MVFLNSLLNNYELVIKTPYPLFLQNPKNAVSEQVYKHRYNKILKQRSKNFLDHSISNTVIPPNRKPQHTDIKHIAQRLTSHKNAEIARKRIFRGHKKAAFRKVETRLSKFVSCLFTFRFSASCTAAFFCRRKPQKQTNSPATPCCRKRAKPCCRPFSNRRLQNRP